MKLEVRRHADLMPQLAEHLQKAFIMKQLLGFILLTMMCGARLAAAANIHEDMVALDRALIPVLVLLAEGQGELSSKAMRVARGRWAAFRNEYQDMKTADADWRRDIQRVDALFWEAYTVIDGGRQLALAQAPLERAIATLVNLRRRNRLEHYFDRVMAFREPLNAIVSPAQGKAPADEKARLIRASYATARQAWERVLGGEPGAGYRLTVNESARLQDRLDVETAALDALGKALDANDPAAIVAAAAATMPPFIGVYNSFGDFHALIWAP
ncbi:MAG: hypothetical protein K8S22_13290 [Betaproteobacteria bacterium]|nr:hypothetical protein [Betaproteobacteria bacterium]